MSNDSQHDPVEMPETGERGEPTAPAAADGTEPSAAAAAGAGADALGTDAGSSTDEVDGIRAEVLDLQDQLARAKADAYNIDQRFNAFVKRSREARRRHGRPVGATSSRHSSRCSTTSSSLAGTVS